MFSRRDFQQKVRKGWAKKLYSVRMICPYCHHTEDKVVDSRSSGLSIRRRRECLACGRRFTTYEYVEVVPLTVTKRDGRHEPFKREKLLAGIDAACKKRPVSRQAIEEIVTRVENTLMSSETQEVSYAEIGNLVMEELRQVDAVAYVRFASVYREFKEVDEFVKQVMQLDSRSQTPRKE
jgi:transcriptional repressor NrdR